MESVSQLSCKIKCFTLCCLSFIGLSHSVLVLAEDIQLAKTQDLLRLSLEDLFSTKITSTSFYPETDLDSGSTVTVIKPNYWDDRGARRLDDALSYMPGITITPTFVGTRQWLIRGYPNSNATGVQTLWDGVPLNTYPVGSVQADHPNFQLNSLNSIEVIRGPGSALYGSDAMHGVVSLKAYESDIDELKGKIRAGSNGYYEGSLNTSYQFANTWRANVALSTNGQPDQDFEYEYLNSGTLSTSERDYNYSNSTTSIKLNSNQKDQLSYKFGIYYNEYKHDDFFHNGTDVPADDSSDIDSNLGILKAGSNYKISSLKSLAVNLSYWEYERHFARTLANLNTINIFAEERQSTVNLIYKDEELVKNTELSVGVEYKDKYVTSAHRTINTPTGTEVLNAALLFSEKGRSINSVLLDGKTRFGQGSNIMRYGFRYDDYSDFGGQFTPRIGYIRYLDKTSVLKVLYGNSFRAPAGNELYGGPLQTGNLNLKPEELNSLELIYITKKDKWKFEAVVFESELTNGIRLVDTNNDSTPDTFANVSKANSRGIELSYLLEESKWGFDINGTYIKSKNKTDNVDFTIVPEYIFNMGASYKITKKWVMTFNNRIMLNSTRTQKTSTNNPDKLPNYWRADLNSTFNYSAKIKVFINIRNLFDRDNYFSSTQDSTRSGNFTTGIQDEGISIDAGLSVHF